jgi:hypothetical protein
MKKIQVDSPQYSTVLFANDSNIVVKTAPTNRYMIGWSIEDVTKYCKIKHWSCIVLEGINDGSK